MSISEKKKATVNYVDNAKLYTVMIKYRTSAIEAVNLGLDKPRVPEYVGHCILEIARRLSTKSNFINYPFVEDMIGDGVENCIYYIDNFNHEKYSNPFAYFTQIIYYAFLRRIQKEKKHLYVKQKTLQNAFLHGLLNEYQEGDDAGGSMIDLDSEYMSAIVEDFEKKLEDKKKKVVKKWV